MRLKCNRRFVENQGYDWASLVAQMVKCLPAMQETQVQSLGQEDLLEEEIATDSNILAWKIPWTVESGWLQSMGSQKVRHNWVTEHACTVDRQCFVSFRWTAKWRSLLWSLLWQIQCFKQALCSSREQHHEPHLLLTVTEQLPSLWLDFVSSWI